MARIIALWTLSIQRMNMNPTLSKFDVMDDDSPITIVMEVNKYYITDNRAEPRKSTMKPSDKTKRVFQSFLADLFSLMARLRLLVVANVEWSNGIVGENQRPPYIWPLTIPK